MIVLDGAGVVHPWRGVVFHRARLEVVAVANDFAFEVEASVLQLLPTQVRKVGIDRPCRIRAIALDRTAHIEVVDAGVYFDEPVASAFAETCLCSRDSAALGTRR